MEQAEQVVKAESDAENQTKNSKPCFLCGDPASLVCEHCRVFVHCSSFHLSKHRVANACLPFRVAESPGLGRSLVATR
jgi:hypothetical protein